MWKYLGVGAALGMFVALQLLLLLFSFSPQISNLIDLVVVSYLKDVLGPVSAGFGGAIAGAYAAYKFQSKSEERKEYKESARVFLLTKLQLNQKFDDLFSIKRHEFHPFRDHKLRMMVIGMLPESPGVRGDIYLRIYDLLSQAGAGKVISDLMLAEKRYAACFYNFMERNKALEEFREKLTSIELGDGLQFSLTDVFKAVELGRVVALHRNTEIMLEVFEEALETVLSALLGLQSALDEKYFPKGSFGIKIEIPSSEYLERLPPPQLSDDELVNMWKHFKSEKSFS